MRLLGCTAGRAGLGIHRSQAGRRGSSPGRGLRVEARRTTSTSSTDSVTSATASGRPRPGGAACVPARCRPGRKPPPPHPAAAAGPGAVHPRHHHWAASAARCWCPAMGLRCPGRDPASATVPGRSASRDVCRPGRCPGGAPWASESPHVAVSRAPLGPSGERITRLDRHCRGPGAKRRDRRSGPVPGPGRPEVTAEDAIHCTARAGVRVVTRVLARGRVAGPVRHRRAGATRLDASGWGQRRGRYRLGVIAEPTVTVSGPAHRRCSAHSRRAYADRAGSRGGTGQVRGALPGSPGLEPLQSGRRWGTDGPGASISRRSRARRPARGLGLLSAGAAGRAPRIAEAGRRESAPV